MMTAKEKMMLQQLKTIFKGIESFPIKQIEPCKALMMKAPDEALHAIIDEKINFLHILARAELSRREALKENLITIRAKYIIEVPSC